MAVLHFSPDDRDDFDILYDGLNGSEKPLKGSEVRVLSGVLDKFEAIGEPVVRGQPTFTLKDEGRIELNKPELGLILEVLEHVPWTAKAARKVARVLGKVQSLLDEVHNVPDK